MIKVLKLNNRKLVSTNIDLSSIREVVITEIITESMEYRLAQFEIQDPTGEIGNTILFTDDAASISKIIVYCKKENYGKSVKTASFGKYTHYMRVDVLEPGVIE